MSDTATPPEGAAAAADSVTTTRAALAAAAAEAAGLPAELASRLQGADLSSLVSDARELAAIFAPKIPAPPDAAAVAATPSVEDGITPTGQRREKSGGMTREQVAKLAKENPREFNRRLEAGEIDLRRVAG